MQSVEVFDNGKRVAEARGITNQPVEVMMPENMKLWSTDKIDLK